jgi:hypothetical protein
VNLSFTAQASNPDIDPARATYAVSRNVPDNTPDNSPTSDGPIPGWADAVLAVVLIGLASRRLGVAT